MTNTTKDTVLEFMERNGIELTRENYLQLAYMGEVPDEIDPEIEFSLPEMFQLDPQIDDEEFE